ncbi:iron ABC transporter substrate-binding protein [Rhizobium wenxiniae]|uniref:Iron complex transport system substrate-binding protein n=1 Tax=Rhizobium wenxiniae TaxID=1737357 RepID=A0A7W9Y6P7_9HYPH|nr:iron ABC transporter substrate-binding protein [Rhizobium wenxiniae]MBB6163004.1 iron complex transport system substrate-binding protein [Rhizobium wenxiniae]GGF94066.1 iron ABC transporter substrate-binding protein [Rhizobium wenxiniae]
MLKLISAVTIAFLSICSTSVWARPFTDAGGRTVEIPDNVTRVLTAGPPASVLVYVLAPEKLTGWVREPSGEEKQFLLPSVRDLPTYGRLTGQGGTANMEAVIAAKPDLIIDVGSVNPTYISLADKVQQQTGISYVLIDGSFANSAKTLRQVGELLGVTPRAEELAAYAETTLKDLGEGLAKVPAGERPKVYYGRGPEGLETGLSGSINLEILEAAGATNVAAAAGKGGLTNVSLEQVLGWNPEIILGASPKFISAVKNDPSWASVAAVKNGKVFAAPSLPFGWFDSPPGINRLIGIRWLEALLYPKTFDVDLKADVQKFFKLFYQVEVTDAQLDTLLKGAIEKH